MTQDLQAEYTFILVYVKGIMLKSRENFLSQFPNYITLLFKLFANLRNSTFNQIINTIFSFVVC